MSEASPGPRRGAGARRGAPGPRLIALGDQMSRSLRTRNYRLFFIGQMISLSGTWMQVVAQGWLVLLLTKSAAHPHGSSVDLGITVALQFAPVMVLGAWGGVVADRVDKRRLQLITQSAALVQALVLGLLIAGGVAQLWMVWVCVVVFGFINVLDFPTRQSFTVEMVGPDDLANAVGLNAVTINASRIVGPAIAGLLIAGSKVAADTAPVFFVNAASYLVVLGCLYAMRPAELLRSKPVVRARGQVRAGLRYAWNNLELRIPLLLMAVVSTLAYNFSVTLPLMATVAFKRGAGTYSALLVAMGVGALAGALAAAARRRLSYRLLVVATLGFGVLSLLAAAATSVRLEMAVLFFLGGAGVVFISSTNALLQLYSAGEMRGRVMALWSVVFLGSTPIGGLVTGVVSERFGPRMALAMGGVASLGAGVAAVLVLRRLRRGGVDLDRVATAAEDDSALLGLEAARGS